MERRERIDLITRELRSISDADLGALIAGANPLGSGIGGVRTVIEIGDVPVFVKKVPLTDIESRAAVTEPTMNLFLMPQGCQYGVGSPGFGVWREVGANKIATSLVVSGRLECFAAMYHCRVMDGPVSDGPLADELADIDSMVDYWHNSTGVRGRVEAIAEASAHVALFLEYVPTTARQWLEDQVGKGPDSASRAVDLIERCLVRDVPKMNAAGLFHFDAHFDNLLTDGNQVYFADFGLASSPSFDLSDAEREFLRQNASHDMAHTITRLVDWLVDEFVKPPSTQARDVFIESVASTGSASVSMNASARRIVERYATVAAAINDFYARLHGEDRTTSFPTEAILAACDQAGLDISKVL